MILLLYLLLNHYSLKKQETIKLLFNKLPDNLSYTQKKYKILESPNQARKQRQNSETRIRELSYCSGCG